MISDLSAPDWASLLGRDASADDTVPVARASGASILVTGAAGFIGSEMVRVLAASGAAKIVLLDLCEQRLFEISSEVTERCVSVIGSVCDAALLHDLFAEHRPEIVVHAAALKHVPLMESNPIAAVATNALGTWQVAQAAEKFHARQLLLVSTDKAAVPASIMGAAKRIAEMIVLAPSRTRSAAIRLVNVIGSPGSAGPLFSAQIARGGPVTVTHPDARRWFFTLPQTVRLLGEAITRQLSGLLLPDPGQPLRIADLAQRMVARSGLDVPIVFTEPRPGEKIDEDLLAPDEQLGGYAGQSLRFVTTPIPEHLPASLAALEAAVAERDGAAMLRVVCELVPAYRPSGLVRTSVQPCREAGVSLP